MTANKMLTETRMRVYQLAIEGVCQTDIARIIGVKKPTVNAHIKCLVNEQFLELNTSKKSAVKIYRKGARSNILDEIILKLNNAPVSTLNSVSGSKNPYAIGVACGSDPTHNQKPSGYHIPVYNVHHVAYLRDVSKQGDSQFLKNSVPLKNGVYQHIGKIQATEIAYKRTRELLGYVPKKQEQTISVALYESIKTDSEGIETASLKLMIYAPTLYLVDNELDNYQQITKTLCEDIYAHIERKYGWHYSSEILETNWDVHFAVVEPNLDGLTEKYTVKSDDNLIGTSNSGKISEMEGVGAEALKVMRAYANMPLKADKLEEKQKVLEQNQKAHLNYVNMIKSEQDALAELMYQHRQAFAEFVELDTKRLKMMSRNLSQSAESIENLFDNSGGMYQ